MIFAFRVFFPRTYSIISRENCLSGHRFRITFSTKSQKPHSIYVHARALTYIIITYEKKFAIQLFGSSSSAIEPRVRTFCPRMVCVRALCRHSAAGGILNARKHLDVPEKSTDIKADYHHHHHQPVVPSRKLYESRIEKKPSRRVTNRVRLARVFCFWLIANERLY